MKTSKLYLALVPVLGLYACGGDSGDQPLSRGSLQVQSLNTFEAYLGGQKLTNDISQSVQNACVNPLISIRIQDSLLGGTANICNADNSRKFYTRLSSSNARIDFSSVSIFQDGNTCEIQGRLNGLSEGQEYEVIADPSMASGQVAQTTYRFRTDSTRKSCSGATFTVNNLANQQVYSIPTLQLTTDDSGEATGISAAVLQEALKQNGVSVLQSLLDLLTPVATGGLFVEFNRPVYLSEASMHIKLRSWSGQLIPVTVSIERNRQELVHGSAGDYFKVVPTGPVAPGMYFLSTNARSVDREVLMKAGTGSIPGAPAYFFTYFRL